MKEQILALMRSENDQDFELGCILAVKSLSREEIDEIFADPSIQIPGSKTLVYKDIAVCINAELRKMMLFDISPQEIKELRKKYSDFEIIEL